MPSKTRLICAERFPTECAVFIDIGMSIVPIAGMTLPTMSTVVQVQLGFAILMVTGRSSGFTSLIVADTVVPGSTTPKSTPGGSAFIGPGIAWPAGAGGGRPGVVGEVAGIVAGGV